MSNITHLKERNLGGCPKLLYAKFADIDWSQWPEEYNGEVNSDIILNAGASWTQVDWVTGTGKYEESDGEQRGFVFEASGKVSKDRSWLVNQLDQHKEEKLILLVYNGNGDKILVGTFDEPAFMVPASRTSGINPKSRNELSVSFVCTRRSAAPFYKSATALPVIYCPPAMETLLSFSTTSPKIGETVVGTPSTNPAYDGVAVDWGEGEPSYSVGTVSHVYKTPGTYTVKMLAGDSSVGAAEYVQANIITVSNDLQNDLCLNFNGSSQYGEVFPYSKFDFGTNDFAIAFWFNTDTLSGPYTLLDKMNSGFSNGIYIDISSNDLRFIISHGSNNTYYQNLSTNTWYHVVAQRKSGVRELWVNGVQSALNSGPTTSGSVTNNDMLYVGCLNGSSRFFQGEQDEIAFFDFGLSSAQVAEVYNSGNRVNIAGLSFAANCVAWWRMGDDGDSTTKITERIDGLGDIVPVNITGASFVAP